MGFADKALLDSLRQVNLLVPHLDRKATELASANADLTCPEQPANGRRLTNVGTFRAYVEAYLRNHPQIHTEGMTLLIRQLKPGEYGLPVELYVFTKTTVWGEYEAIQADIFDHLLAAAPEFDLRVFQNPTGADFGALSAE